MKEKNDTNSSEHPVPDLSQDYDYLKSCSSNDCTGAVPSAPQTSSELDSYLDVYDFLPQSSLTHPNDVEIDIMNSKKKK